MTDYVKELRKQGYGEQEIQDVISPYKNNLLEQGYAQEEIDELFSKPKFDDTELKDFTKNVGSDVPEEAEGVIESFQSGYQASASGMLARGEKPGLVLSEDASLDERITGAIGGIVSDLPFIATGAIAGAPGGAAGSIAGAFALPAGARKILMDGFENGSIDTPGEFIERLAGATTEATKGYLVGLATSFSGGGAAALIAKTKVPKALTLMYGSKTAATLTGSVKVGAEAVGMSTAAAGFEGRLPTMQEIGDAAILFGAAKSTPPIVKGLTKSVRNTFTRTGKTPEDLARDIEVDGTIREDVVSEMDVPRSYTELSKDSDIGLSPKQKANTPEGRVEAQIARDKEVLTKPFSMDNAYTQLVDKTNPIKLLSKEILKGKKIPADSDPYIGVRLYAGTQGKITHFTEFGTFNHKTLEPTGPGLKQILKDVKDDKLYEQYSLSKRTLDVSKRGIETGIDYKDATQIVKKHDKQFGKIFEENKKYRERTIDFMVDSGLLSKESKASMNDLSQDYVPLNRYFNPETIGKLELNSGKKSGSTNIFNPVKRLKGGKDKIISPIESDIKNSYSFINLAEKNTMIGKMIALKDQPGGNKYIEELKPNSRKITIKNKELEKLGVEGIESIDIFRPNILSSKPGEVVWFDKGEARVFKVDPTVAKVYENLNNTSSNMLVKMMSPLAKTFRAGTTLTPNFMLKNLLRDNVTVGVQSKNSFIPFVDGMKGLASMFKKDGDYKEWLRSGGANSSLVSMDINYIKDAKYKILQGGKRNSPFNVMENLRVAAELSDSLSRVGEFKKSRGKSNTPASLMQAAFDSREVSMDFARMGTSIQAWNQITAFANARIGSIDRFNRAMKENPVATGAKVAGFIMLPSALQWLAIHDDPDYIALPQWRKDLFMHFKVNGYLVPVPRAFEPGVIFGAGTDRMLSHIFKNDDKKSIQDSFRGLIGNSGLLDASSLAIPTGITSMLSNHTNTNLHMGTPLVPASREKLLPQYKYTAGTTELTKYLSRLSLAFTPDSDLVNVKQRTPIAIDNHIRSITGGAGTLFVKTADLALRKAGLLPDPTKPEESLKQSVFVKSFVVRNPGMNTSHVEKFYKRARTNDMFIKTADYLEKIEGNLEEADKLRDKKAKFNISYSEHAAAISAETTLIKFIEFGQDGLSSEEKRQSIDVLYSSINFIAMGANEEIEAADKDLKNNKRK